MNLTDHEIWDLTQLWPVVVPLLILASLSVSLLALPYWGVDLLYSSIAQFFILLPLVLYATLVYITKAKLDSEEREVPST